MNIEEEEVAIEEPAPSTRPSPQMKLRDRKQIQTPKRLKDYVACAMLVGANTENITIEEAMKNENWQKAIQEELSSLKKHEVWKLVEVPSDGKVPTQM